MRQIVGAAAISAKPPRGQEGGRLQLDAVILNAPFASHKQFYFYKLFCNSFLFAGLVFLRAIIMQLPAKGGV